MANIMFSLTDDRHRLTSDLVEGELFAIGQFTVAWGMFEHLMFAQTYMLCERAQIALPEAAQSLSLFQETPPCVVGGHQDLCPQREGT